jgi:hypothetical protein
MQRSDHSANPHRKCFVLPSPFFIRLNQRISELTIQYRLPTMFPFKNQVEAGGLDVVRRAHIHANRRAGYFAAKILRGAKPCLFTIRSVASRQKPIDP